MSWKEKEFVDIYRQGLLDEINSHVFKSYIHKIILYKKLFSKNILNYLYLEIILYMCSIQIALIHFSQWMVC